MIVIDTSVLVDYVFEKDKNRNNVARKALKVVKGKKVSAPRIILVELLSVARRLGMNVSRFDIIRLVSDFILFPESIILDEALKIAEKVHPRAVDAYFIATAKMTDSILITNDKIMARNAKKAGIKAYYLIEEFDKAMKELNKA